MKKKGLLMGKTLSLKLVSAMNTSKSDSIGGEYMDEQKVPEDKCKEMSARAAAVMSSGNDGVNESPVINVNLLSSPKPNCGHNENSTLVRKRANGPAISVFDLEPHRRAPLPPNVPSYSPSHSLPSSPSPPKSPQVFNRRKNSVPMNDRSDRKPSLTSLRRWTTARNGEMSPLERRHTSDSVSRVSSNNRSANSPWFDGAPGIHTGARRKREQSVPDIRKNQTNLPSSPSKPSRISRDFFSVLQNSSWFNFSKKTQDLKIGDPQEFRHVYHLSGDEFYPVNKTPTSKEKDDSSYFERTRLLPSPIVLEMTSNHTTSTPKEQSGINLSPPLRIKSHESMRTQDSPYSSNASATTPSLLESPSPQFDYITLNNNSNSGPTTPHIPNTGMDNTQASIYFVDEESVDPLIEKFIVAESPTKAVHVHMESIRIKSDQTLSNIGECYIESEGEIDAIFEHLRVIDKNNSVLDASSYTADCLTSSVA